MLQIEGAKKSLLDIAKHINKQINKDYQKYIKKSEENRYSELPKKVTPLSSKAVSKDLTTSLRVSSVNAYASKGSGKLVPKLDTHKGIAFTKIVHRYK